MILDHDFHKVGDRNSPGVVAPVQIGRGVTIGARVTMLRGARIGDGARVMSGSTISGVIASGLPAWNGFGAVRLQLALEETFGVRLSDTDVCSAASVADLARLIAQAGPRRI